MGPKRKKQAPGPSTSRKGKKAKKAEAEEDDPTLYTSAQKAAITQFVNFTQLDRNTAARVLKNHAWDPQIAVNA
ncbi:hypothetical protein IQ07DRAFT_152056 [Pyrenochaeta sp. DS3sAY3a]|nr:hypothetical protein IQ07DRAFT_152056 [Pyrenochaeta sp. DS3sAY3a]